MRKVWKYELNPPPFNTMELRIPLGGKPLLVAMQGDIPCFWCEVDVSTKGHDYVTIYSVPTGEEIPHPRAFHIGSVVMQNMEVYHFYAVVNSVPF